MSRRIAYISSTFPDYKNCGVGIYASYVTQYLAEMNHDVHVITTAIPEIKNNHGKVTIHKTMQSWGLLELPRLIQTLMKIKPDIVHITHPTSIAAARSKFLMNVFPEINQATTKWPIVTTLHEFETISKLARIKILPLLYGSNKITVTNQSYKKTLLEYLPKSFENKIEIIDIGACSDIPTSTTPLDGKALRQRYGLTPENKVLGFVGFITPPKGFENLILALSKLIKKDPSYRILALSSWNLSSPDYKNKIQQLIEKHQLSDKVIISGFLSEEEIWQSMEAIDLCAFPFSYAVERRSSASIRKALFKGLPVITYAQDLNYSEFGFENKKNIILSPLGNEDAFVENISSFFNHPEQATKMSQEAKKLSSAFSYESIANDFSRLYSKL